MVEFESRLFEDMTPNERPSITEALISIVSMLHFLGVGIIALYDGITNSILMGTGVTALSVVSMNFFPTQQFISIVVPGMSFQSLYHETGEITE